MQQQPFHQLSSPLGAKITANGQPYLYFGGTAYLGIPQNKVFLAHYTQGLGYFGLNNGTSRGNNVQLGIYDEAEAYAATNFGAQAALITSSGYLAAQLAVKNLAKGGGVGYAPNTHPALWLSQAENNSGTFNDWATEMVAQINSSAIQNWVLMSNSMNNLLPEKYDFSFVEKLNKQVLLIVDDSHGIGITNNGKGVFAEIPQSANIEVVVVASMAKALGVDAGLILGTAKTIGLLKQTPEFLGASPPSAAGLYAFMQAESIYEQALIQLNKNISFFEKRIQHQKEWRYLPNFPVFLAPEKTLHQQLVKQNILISAFPYPNPNSEIVNRIVLSSWHTIGDIDKLAIHLTQNTAP